MLECIISLGCFLLMGVIQSLVINGVHEAFKGGKVNDIAKGEYYTGNILYMIAPKFFENNKNKYWSKPLWSCIRCMASVYGALTFWPFVVYFFGFRVEQVFVYGCDVFMLVFLNYYFYKKV